MCECVSVDVFVLEAESYGLQLWVVCARRVKWRRGENRGTRLYNGVRTPPASRSLHLSAAAP